MCEFNIKRIDAVNADTEKDRRGCYKRGDIISVRPDGAYIDKPHMTVLAVPGVSHTAVEKLMGERYVLVSKQVEIPESIYQADKDSVYTITVNEVEHTVAMGKYIDPELVSNVDGVRIYNVKMIETYQRRRFRFPEDAMAQIFPDGIYRREVTKNVFLNQMDKIYDKSFSDIIQNLTWRQNMIDQINGA